MIEKRIVSSAIGNANDWYLSINCAIANKYMIRQLATVGQLNNPNAWLDKIDRQSVDNL